MTNMFTVFSVALAVLEAHAASGSTVPVPPLPGPPSWVTVMVPPEGAVPPLAELVPPLLLVLVPPLAELAPPDPLLAVPPLPPVADVPKPKLGPVSTEGLQE
jgi:hypothetical protein